MRPRFGYYARILHSCTDQSMTSALASMDLTAAQGHILGFVHRSPQPPCPRDIEEAFRLSHPTVSGLLTRLEKKGFIEFRPDENDRRCKRIYMLPKGQNVVDTMHRTIEQNERRMVQGFTEQEKEQFAQFMQRAIENMGAATCKRKHKEDPQK